MAIKTYKTRIKNKIDTEAVWNTKTSFIPLKGEAIIYEVDADHEGPRIKFGDGIQSVVNLPFVSTEVIASNLTEVPYPVQSNTLTYTGSSQSVAWSGYDTSKMTISGNNTVSATYAGTYNVSFTLKSGYCWPNGSTEPYNTNWKINKATPTLSVNKSSINFTPAVLTATITVTTNSTGTVYATSNNTSIATTSVSGKTVTANYAGDGSTTITIGVPETTNYLAKSIDVTVEAKAIVSLEEYSWAEISAIGKAGNPQAYFAIGDTKMITLNGDIGWGLQLSQYPVYVYIIDFFHDNNASIQFGTFKHKNKDGSFTDICFIDTKYGNGYVDSTEYFSMYESIVVTGGWKDSQMRSELLGSTESRGYNAPQNYVPGTSRTLAAALPSELRAVMQPMTVWTNNTGSDSSANESDITATIDYLPLLSEYEVFGKTINSYSMESQYQTQYQYFASGNSKTKFKYSELPNTIDPSTSNLMYWWLRSPALHTGGKWCCISQPYSSLSDYSTGGTSTTLYPHEACGIAPIFSV